MPTKPRYFDTEKQAIQIAKQRAKSGYSSQYIYLHPSDGKLYIRGGPTDPANPENKPIYRVTFAGTLYRLDQDQEEAK